jgi:zinc protease
VLCSCAAATSPHAETQPVGDSGSAERPARDLEPARVGEHVFHRRLLGNGLRAAAARDRGEGVSVFVIVAAGKRQETPSTTGLAHLTEHAMYTGTANTGPGEHDRRIRRMGGRSNAFTREDYTLFYDHEVPTDQLDEVLAMEADRLRGLSFDEAAVYVERERLRREEEETWQPSQRLTELLEAAVFREHPYGAGILDEQGHTLAPGLEIEQIREFYDRHYQPGSTAVVVAGAIEPGRALDAIQRAFSPLPPAPAAESPPEEPAISEPRSVTLPSDLPRDRVEWVWLVPAMGHRDRPALDVLARLLSRRTAPSGAPVLASAGNRVDRDLFRLAVTGPTATRDLEEILRDLLEGRIEAAEVEEVKQLMADGAARQPLRARPYFALAATFGVYEALGYTQVLTGYASAVAELSAERVIRVARRHLDPQRRVEVHSRGTGAEIRALPEDPVELLRAAEAAAQAGDLDRAAAAYTAVLARNPTKMTRVIALASRGKLQLQQRDYEGAIRDFEAALAVIDYPDLRAWIDEARALQAGADRETSDSR